jgi:hypothetical protein
MAKRRGIKKLYMCFIPFVNFVVLGKLIGRTNIWGLKIKNIGLWLAIISAFTFVTDQLLLVGDYIFVLERVFLGGYIEFSSQIIIDFLNYEGVIYSIISICNMVVSLAELFLEIGLIFTVFRLYKPERATLYSFLSIFLGDLIFGILLFSVRNNNYVTIDDFLRMRAEQNRARYGGYYGGYNNSNGNNTSGNQWGNPYNNNGGQNSYEEKDPFPEFSDKKENESQTNRQNRQNSSADGNNQDDLFN